jgi:hypothetical protein
MVDRDEDEKTAVDDAMEFLKAELQNRAVEQQKLKKDWEHAGGSMRTLRRAKSTLNVESSKQGFGGAWMWKLPT